MFLALVAILWGASSAAAGPFTRAIYFDSSASPSTGPSEAFVAREARRYIFAVTKAMPVLVDVSSSPGALGELSAGQYGEAIVVTSPEAALVQAAQALVASSSQQGQVLALRASPMAFAYQEHYHDVVQVRAAGPGQGAATLLIGATPQARLYAAYSLAEHLGVRFELHGDILPDPTAAGGLPLAAHAQAPLPLQHTQREHGGSSPTFAYRGLQPFHDFLEGPDTWDTEHYKHIFTQVSKMKMNFVGLHTYPYSSSNPGHTTGRNEPTVWVGTKEQLNQDGSVKASYPTSYANSLRGEWAEAAMATSNYSWGTANIFESDCWPAPPAAAPGSCPYPTTPEASNVLFEATSTMLEDAFRHGKGMGVESCVGTETPLSKPPAGEVGPTCRPSNGTGHAEACYQDGTTRVFPHTVTINDRQNSREWCATECARANFSFAGVEYGVACFCGTAVPDASKKIDAARCEALECPGADGEMCGGSYAMLVFEVECPDGPPAPLPTTQEYYEGMFTRLQKKVPSLSWYWVWTPEGWEWGHMDASNPIFTDAVNDLAAAMAAKEATAGFNVKMATNGWVVGPLPDRSIFDERLPSSWDAITSIDLNTGHSPVDPAYANVTHHAKWAIPWMEDDPTLTQPQLWVNRTLEHMEDAAHYNCSGLLGIHWRTRATSPQIAAMARKSWMPSLTSGAFWADWVSAQFGLDPGSDGADKAAAIFGGVDSFAMPIVTRWGGGPGQMSAGCPADVQGTFAFVDELVALSISGEISGAANQARFAYWVDTFSFMRSMAFTECAATDYAAALAAVAKAPDAVAQKALAKLVGIPARVGLVANATAMMTYLQRTISNPGELGTYMNLESHSLRPLLDSSALVGYLGGGALPPDALLPTTYGGDATRLIVPTARSTADKGAPMAWRALVLAGGGCTPSGVQLWFRPLGSTDAFSMAALAPLGRAVFALTAFVDKPLPSVDFEYYLETTGVGGCAGAVFPAGAPDVTQSVVWL